MFLNQVPMLAANLTLLVVALSVMSALSPTLCLVIAVFIPAFALLAVRFRDRIFPSSWNDQRLLGNVAGVVEEAFSWSARSQGPSRKRSRELALLLASARELFRVPPAQPRALPPATRASPCKPCRPSRSWEFCCCWAGSWPLHGARQFGRILAFSSYLIQLLAPIRLLSGMLASSQQARAGAERVPRATRP